MGDGQPTGPEVLMGAVGSYAACAASRRAGRRGPKLPRGGRCEDEAAGPEALPRRLRSAPANLSVHLPLRVMPWGDTGDAQVH